ncbi:hypothetical protein AB0B25_20600 [Nocardia sp. NPDC049190]|uniref:hypothetical protein n=1 Tax=Nocardia sp. NPDC049190 TaxID=3155650 RepID=UPI0033CA797D
MQCRAGTPRCTTTRRNIDVSASDWRDNCCSSGGKITSKGIPHTEIDPMLVNGESVDFGYHGQAIGSPPIRCSRHWCLPR